MVHPVKPVDQQDQRQHLPALHHQLGQGLHQEGKGVFQLAFDQHGHRPAVQTKRVHLLLTLPG